MSVNEGTMRAQKLPRDCFWASVTASRSTWTRRTAVRPPARLQDEARGHRKQARNFAPLGTIAGLDQKQEPGCAGGEAGDREDWGFSTYT